MLILDPSPYRLGGLRFSEWTVLWKLHNRCWDGGRRSALYLSEFSFGPIKPDGYRIEVCHRLRSSRPTVEAPPDAE